MSRRVNVGDLRSRLSRPADTMPVRAMALIFIASAALLLFGLLINADQLPVSKEQRMVSIAVTAGLGVVYWFTARRFRLWMLHAIIILGLFSGCLALSRMHNSTAAAMAILSILWTCLLIGSTFRPPTARLYGAITFLGICLALQRSDATEAEGAVMALGFGLTMIVTMEILSQTGTRLRDEANHDPLTGLLNRKGLIEAASTSKRASLRNGEPIAIVHFDLDDFKSVNDREGHLAGDRLLISCAEAWRSNIRPQDVLARPGGDEFVLLLPGANAEEAEATLRRLAEASPVGFSYGISVAMPYDSIEDKLREADTELIRAKAALHDPSHVVKKAPEVS